MDITLYDASKHPIWVTFIVLGVYALVVCILILIISATVAAKPLPFTSPYTVFLPVAFAPALIPAQGAGATYADCDRIAASGLTWFYDWSSQPPECPTAQHVAMIWSESQVSAQIAEDVDWVLGFNEPEMSGQANITPTLGAELWRQIEQDYPDKKLVSASASLGWLTQWWDIYVAMYDISPRVDAVGSHCYGAWDSGYAIAKCQGEAGAIVAWAQARDIPEVWVTEFAHLPCWPGGEAGSIEFMEAMVAYYQDDPTITRWAWFQNSYHGDERWSFGPYCNTSLVDIGTGELTAMGVAYKELGKGWWPW